LNPNEDVAVVASSPGTDEDENVGVFGSRGVPKLFNFIHPRFSSCMNPISTVAQASLPELWNAPEILRPI
jgi:hypothetical protein